MQNIKRFALSDLRLREVRAEITGQADALLRADSARRRRMRANDELGGAKPAPTKTARDAGPFSRLREHPLYRASRNGASHRS